MLKETRRCELCSDFAKIYCPSDAAYLCWDCDSAVHSANFLVARHVRSTVCSCCGDFDGDRFSDAGINCFARLLCRSCGNDVVDGSSLSSSVCISTTESSTAAARPVNSPNRNASVCSRGQDSSGEVSSEMRRGERSEKKTWRLKVDVTVEGILVNWCKRLGLDGKRDDLVVATAGQVLEEVSLGRLTNVPTRVALAASFWLGIRSCGDKAVVKCQNLKRVEKITGVPAKVIQAVEGKLGRVSKTRGRMARDSVYEEGWAEC